MKDRIPTYPGRVKLSPVPGRADTYDMERADEPIEAGTALNKANLLTDEVAALIWPDEETRPADPTPNQALEAIAGFISNSPKIVHGSYTGTDENGSTSPCRLMFDFAPKFIWIYAEYHKNNKTFKPLTPPDTTERYWTNPAAWPTTSTKGYGFGNITSTSGSTNYGFGYRSEDGKTVTWFNTQNYGGQLNASVYDYYYLAMG